MATSAPLAVAPIRPVIALRTRSATRVASKPAATRRLVVGVYTYVDLLSLVYRK